MNAFDHIWNLAPVLRDVAAFALAGIAGIWRWIRSRQAQSWPSTQGTISETAVRRKNNLWTAEFIYSYTVEGQYYSGFHLLAAWSKKKAEALIEGWKGRMVIVRYVRTKHEISVLLKSDQPGGQLGSRFATQVPGAME
jgi:hypothetical protein